MIDQLLEEKGIQYEELTAVERETLHVWMDTLQKGQLSVEKIREYIANMKDAVALEAAKEPQFVQVFIFKVANWKLTKLQARLENYIMLSTLLSTPERLKEQIENAIAGIAKTK